MIVLTKEGNVLIFWFLIKITEHQHRIPINVGSVRTEEQNCRGPGTLHFMELLRFKSHLQSQWGSAAIFTFSNPPQNSNPSEALCTSYTIEAVDIDWDVQ